MYLRNSVWIVNPKPYHVILIKVLKRKVKISWASTYKVLMPLFPAQQFAGKKIKIIQLWENPKLTCPLPLSHHPRQGGEKFHKVCCPLSVVVPSPGYKALTHPHELELLKLPSQIGILSLLCISVDYSHLCCCWTQFDCLSSRWKDRNETVPPGDNPTNQENFSKKN